MGAFPDIFTEMAVLLLLAVGVGALGLSLGHINAETMGLITPVTHCIFRVMRSAGNVLIC